MLFPLLATRPDLLARSRPICSAASAEVDVVVIGSGIGGLCAGALAAHSGLKVAVCESHDAPGGAAHEWTVKGFHFESGPSLYAGLSPDRSPNPLKHVFQIIGEEPGHTQWAHSLHCRSATGCSEAQRAWCRASSASHPLRSPCSPPGRLHEPCRALPI